LLDVHQAALLRLLLRLLRPNGARGKAEARRNGARGKVEARRNGARGKVEAKRNDAKGKTEASERLDISPKLKPSKSSA